jgi:general secretion pathway protein D
VGTRQTSTSLRLKDGQTQVLAGLINDQERRSTAGLPGLNDWPLVGRLFGVTQDKRTKTEIVMLITPRIVRHLERPADAELRIPSGTDNLPGAAPLRVPAGARVGLAPGRGGSTGGPPVAAAAEEPTAAERSGALQLSGSAEARVGQTVAVTLANRSGQKASGELVFDPLLLQPAGAGAAGATHATSGRLPFALDAQGESAVILRVLPAAAGQRVPVQASANVPVEGDVQLRVPASEAGR